MYKVADAHCDTAWRIARESMDFFAPDSPLHNRYANLLAGGVCLQVMACFAGSQGMGKAAWEWVVKSLDVLDTLKGMPFVTDLAALSQGPSQLTFLKAVEGGEALGGDMGRLEVLYERGVRLLTLTWNHPNELGYGAVSGNSKGLTPFGLEVVKRMNQLGMAIDVSHLNEKGFYDVYDHSTAPFMASHSCVEQLHSHPRNLTVDQIKALIERKGFIGINFYPVFLGGTQDVEEIVRHVDKVVSLGGEKCVGFGSDFDGIERLPKGIEGPQHFPRILEALEKRGYSSEILENIAWKNLCDSLARIGRAKQPA